MINRYNFDNLLLMLAVAVNVFLVFTLFSGLSEYQTGFFFNSDALYLPSLYRDLIVEGNSLEGWNTAPSILFMPDVILFFLLRALTGNFIIAAFAFGLVQYLAIAGFGILIFRAAFPDRTFFAPAFMLILLSIFLMVSIVSHHFIFASYLFLNGFHTGAFLMALISVWLSLRYLQTSGRSWLIALYVVAPLSVASDLLFVVMYPMAFGFSLIFRFFYQKDTATKRLLILIAISTAAGLLIFWGVRQSGYIHLGRAAYVMDFDNILPSFRMLVNQLSEYLSAGDFRSVIILLAGLSLVGQMVYLIRRLLQRNITSLRTLWLMFSVLFILGVYAAPVATGSYTGFDSLRYNFAAIVLAIINPALLIPVLFNRSHLVKQLLRGGAVILLTVWLVTGLVNFRAPGLHDFFNYYPELARQADKIASQYDLKKGIADFWKAKFITMFSKEGLEVYPAFEYGHPYHHLLDEDVFYDESSEFNFIIRYGFKDEERYTERFPAGTLIDSSFLKITLLPDFRFEKKTYMPVFIDRQ